MTSWAIAAKRNGLPKRMRDVVGAAVVTTRTMSNGYLEMPAGTRAVVTSVSDWTRVRVRGVACSCCGVAPVMTVDALSLRPASQPENLTSDQSGMPK